MDDDELDREVSEKLNRLKNNMTMAFTKGHVKEFMRCYSWIFLTWMAFFLVGICIGSQIMEVSATNYINSHYGRSFCYGMYNDSPKFEDGLKDGIVKDNLIKIIGGG